MFMNNARKAYIMAKGMEGLLRIMLSPKSEARTTYLKFNDIYI